MAELTITMKPKSGSRKITAFVQQSEQKIKSGLRKAGAIILKDWTQKIGGEGFVRNPGRASKYPGIMKGDYFGSLSVKSEDGGMAVSIGPRGLEYPIFHEAGTRHMPARPVIPDVWKDSGDDALNAFQRTIAEPLKR